MDCAVKCLSELSNSVWLIDLEKAKSIDYVFYLPMTVGSRSTITHRGTYLPAPVSSKNVLKLLSTDKTVWPGIWPSAWIPYKNKKKVTCESNTDMTR